MTEINQTTVQTEPEQTEPETRKMLLGLYADMEGAITAVRQLHVAQRIPPQKLTLLTQTDIDDIREVMDEDLQSGTARGAAIGAVIGLLLGVLGGLVIVPIMGLGSLLATSFIGAVAGLFAGSYYGAIYGTRMVSQDEYEVKETLAEGGGLIIIDIDAYGAGKRKALQDLLHRYDPSWVMMDEQVALDDLV